MASATFREIIKIIQRIDPDIPRPETGTTDSSDLQNEMAQYFTDRECIKSVLGIDIYKYSSFPAPTQRLVPVVFGAVYEMATHLSVDLEPVLFKHSDFSGNTFISTGDGGFQIFDNPLQAIVFATAFQVTLAAYNTSVVYPRLRHFVGPLTTRYALTRDLIVQLDANWYGSAIISNARILACDHLNRFLIDSHTIDWFVAKLGSVESLLIQQVDDLQKLFGVEGAEPPGTLFFKPRGSPLLPQNAFRAIDVLHIGTVTAKSQPLDVYNLHIQVFVKHILAEAGIDQNVVVALGNLNTAGISG